MTHPLLTGDAERVISAFVKERVDEQVNAALEETLGPPSRLTPELREALSEIVADRVPRAVDVALGMEPEPTPGAIDEAARSLCEWVAGLHAVDRETADTELSDRLTAEFAGDFDEALLEVAVEDTARWDAAANDAALRLLETRLQRALASPHDVREAAVREALDAERVRIGRRDAHRFVRVLSRLHGERVQLLELEA